MRKILVSLGMLTFVGAIVVGATGAFFSDTETSTGNTFAAGDVDLQIDNESYALDFNIPEYEGPTGQFIFSTSTSWEMADIDNSTFKFFNFSDVKPGDYGEDTISIHVGSNDAWLCAAARLTTDSDVSYTEPEENADDSINLLDPVSTDGELDSVLNFAFWADDGDNVFEPVPGQNGGVAESVFLGGPLSNLDDAGQIALASPQGGAFGSNPIPGNDTVYIGKIWCAGDLTSTNLVQDGSSTLTNPTMGTGFNCDGSLVDNSSQTDIVQGDMQFYAVQARNNAQFSCAENYDPAWD